MGRFAHSDAGKTNPGSSSTRNHWQIQAQLCPIMHYWRNAAAWPKGQLTNDLRREIQPGFNRLELRPTSDRVECPGHPQRHHTDIAASPCRGQPLQSGRLISSLRIDLSIGGRRSIPREGRFVWMRRRNNGDYQMCTNNSYLTDSIIDSPNSSWRLAAVVQHLSIRQFGPQTGL